MPVSLKIFPESGHIGLFGLRQNPAVLALNIVLLVVSYEFNQQAFKTVSKNGLEKTSTGLTVDPLPEITLITPRL